MLQQILRDKFEKLGDTDEGSAWCNQALNPAIGPLVLRGIPDADAFPSVCLDYERVVSIPPPASATGVWTCIMNVLPHPIQPASFICTTTGGQIGYGGIVNPTFALVTQYSSLTAAFGTLCNSFRMLYCGVTIDLDASAMTDSGSVVAGQFPLEFQRINYALPKAGACVAYAHLLNCNYNSNFPGQSVSQLPGAYAGLAKDGIYMPIKLDPAAPWATTNAAEMACVANPTSAVPPTADSLRLVTLPNATPTLGNTFPFYGSSYYGTSAPFVGAWAFTDNTVNGDVAAPLQQSNMGHIVFYNLNVAASLTVKVRWGVEMRVEPTSLLAPALKPSARHDVLALTAYSDVAGSLPWAYPSAYNANGKLAGMIKGLWNRVRPALATGLSFIPHPVAQAASGVLTRLPDFERPSGTGTTVAKSEAPLPRATPRATRAGSKRRKAVVKLPARKR